MARFLGNENKAAATSIYLLAFDVKLLVSESMFCDTKFGKFQFSWKCRISNVTPPLKPIVNGHIITDKFMEEIPVSFNFHFKI